MRRLAWLALIVLALAARTSSPAWAASAKDWQPTYPATPYPNVNASRDPSIIAEGEYLVRAVAHCPSCHVRRAQILNADPQTLAKLPLAGGEEWSLGPIGTIRSANITSDASAGIGAWQDREIARVVKSAVDREGRAVFFMNGLGYFDDRDVTAIVSYLRTLAPVDQPAPLSEITVDGRETLQKEMQGWLRPRAIRPVQYVARGGRSVGRGAYLANGPARCIHCHSGVSDSPRVELRGPAFAGSQWAEPDPENPSMEVNAPNLTPSRRYGAITGWTEQAFVSRFRAGRGIKSSTMPWEDFRLLSDDDLGSLFLYLKSLKAVDRNPGPSYRPLGWKPEKSAANVVQQEP